MGWQSRAERIVDGSEGFLPRSGWPNAVAVFFDAEFLTGEMQ
jgi:hypothetical protein